MIWIIVIYGLLYGLTGFLPVSSSGHFSVLGHTLGLNVSPEISIILNLSGIILIIYVFRRDIKILVKETFFMLGRLFGNIWICIKNIFAKEKKEYKRIMVNNYDGYALFLLLAMIPEAVMTFFMQPVAYVADLSLLVPGLCLLINGVILLIADNLNPGYRSPTQISIYTGIIIGLAQGIGLLPGFSYLAVAFTAALLFGYQKEFAVRTSFFLMIPPMLVDLIFNITKMNGIPEIFCTMKNIPAIVVMAALLMVVGNICIRATLLIVRKKKFWLLAAENMVMGIFSLVWYFLFR